jgi:hypothetical protein
MTIGELNLNLGIKGAKKTVDEIDGVRKGLKDTAAMSLEAKAAIIGAVYALERMFSKSGQAGTNLTNFNALTDLSAKKLQQWQYAARQAGVSNEEFEGSLKGVQGAMTNMLLGKGAPEGLQILANKVGFDAKRARDTFYVMQKLQEFAKSAPADVGNAVIKSFGVGEGTIAALRRGAFNEKAFKKAPTYSDNEIQALDKANIAWSNLGNKIEMAFGRFNAMHGGQLVKDISMITDQVVKLVEAFTTLAEKIKLFQVIGKAFEGWNMIIGGVTKGVTALQDSKTRNSLLSGRLTKGQSETLADAKSTLGYVLKDFLGSGPTPSNSPGIIAPPMSKGVAGGSKQQNITVNQNLNFQHDGKNSGKTATDLKKANQDAFRQFSLGEAS